MFESTPIIETNKIDLLDPEKRKCSKYCHRRKNICAISAISEMVSSRKKKLNKLEPPKAFEINGTFEFEKERLGHENGCE